MRRRGWLAAAWVTAGILLATQVFPDRPGVPLGILLRGVVLGSGVGLLAVGLVLTYRATRIINFAYGAMGGIGGGLAAGLTLGKGWPWELAVVGGVAAGVAVGAVSERLVIRRFANAPRLVVTVTTIGLAQLLGGVALLMPDWLGSDELIPGFDTPLSQHRISIGPSSFDANDGLLVAVVPVVLAGLVWFLQRSTAGIAVRGMAENLDRARLLGIPTGQLSLLLWSVVGGLAALTAALRLPNEGISFDATVGPVILLPPLAAAVVAGMRSLPAAFAAGVGVGVVDQVVAWNVERRATTHVVLLGIVVVGLLLQHGGVRRDGATAGAAEHAWTPTAAPRRLPELLATLPEVRAAKLLAGAAVLAAVAAVPLAGSPAQINTASIGITLALAALSLVVLTGWGGVVSLGQVALIGVGGVVMGNALASWGIDIFLALVLSAAAGALVALLLGLPALRVSGELLAVTTLAFAVAMQLFILNPANFAWLVPQSYARPELLHGAVDLADERWLYLLALGLLALAVFVVRNLRSARTGRAIVAGRDNPRNAAAVGISTTTTRLMAFVLSGVFAGVAGGVHAIVLRGIGLNTYPAADSLLVLSMAVIGGVSSIGGTLAGVALVVWLGYVFPEQQLLLTGVGLVVILMVLPGGLAQAAERARDWLVGLAAGWRGIPPVDAVDLVDQAGHVGSGAWLPTEVNPSGLVAGATRRRALLACQGVEASYGSLPVLFGVDVAVGRHDMLALLGTNGAGKSTVLRVIAGLLPPRHGRITFGHHNIGGLPPERIARLGLVLVPGDRGVFPTLTVAENLRLASWMIRRDPEEVRAALDEALTLFPGLAERTNQRAGDLSNGEQQQLSLAMGFVTRPWLLCIDELSRGLAPAVVAQLVDTVRAMHARGVSVLLVEQSVSVAMMLCQRAMFLEKGQVRYRGYIDGLLRRPDILRAVFLGGDRGGGNGAEAAAGKGVGAGAGVGAGTESSVWTRPVGRAPPRRVMLECRGLIKRFGGIRAVDRVDLTVYPGTIVGLIGHNGAGKTTLFDLLTGFTAVDRGLIRLNGVDITRLPPHRRAIAEVGRSFEEARLFPSLTVADTLRVALERHLASRDPLAAALRLPASTLSERSASRRADELVELLGLGADYERLVGDLSMGTRRIVELGVVLAQDAAVVLFDEPSLGLAQPEAEALGPLLRQVQSETGCSMVVIEHDMDLLSSLSDYFVALEQGAVIAVGPPRHVLANPRVVASYLGTAAPVVRG